MIKIYVDKNKDRIIFEIWYCWLLELLTLETQKLLGNSESEIENEKNERIFQN